jgi:CO/xanthine dehydrogenase FAD-binding subunit
VKPLPNFSLHRPRTLEETLELLAEHEGSRLMAGGTDLLILLREGDVRAEHLIDLGSVEELRYIREDGGTVHIGAATTHDQLLNSEIIAAKAPILGEAVASIGSVQIRNRGTIGGNLCNASPAADTVPPLLVLDAEVTVTSSETLRTFPLIDLFIGPKMTSLALGELLTEISFRVPPRGSGASFHKLGRRKGLTLSVVNAAAYLTLDGSTCIDAGVALGAVASTPLRMHAIEAMLRGEALSRQLIEASASACSNLVRPIDDIRASAEYRREMSRVLARRAITGAWERARSNMK